MNNEAGRRAEEEAQVKRKTQLARLARISMDQAIQIAVSKTSGKVLECSLVGERWEGAGELAKPSLVLYHVVILSGDEANPTTYHVLVNAMDGTIFRSEKEERRNETTEGFAFTRRDGEEQKTEFTRSGGRSLEGGVLNGKAASLPLPEYPAIARSAHAEGAVQVRIMIDEGGNVIEATALSGHPLLRAAAVSAARDAKFTQTRLQGEPVRVTGILVYNFAVQ
jgi:TonB family protein